jgi:hypothetical protein
MSHNRSLITWSPPPSLTVSYERANRAGAFRQCAPVAAAPGAGTGLGQGTYALASNARGSIVGAYTRRATVSMYFGFSADSPKASQSFRMAVCVRMAVC